MGGGRRRGGNKAAAKRQLTLGDLVLAKVKGFPPWPAKVSRPEDWKKSPDPKKIFVYFFGTGEIAFVAPANIRVFTNETKGELVARCQGKSKLVRGFGPAVKEICAAFDELQSDQLSSFRDNTDELQKSIDSSEDDEEMETNSVGITKETANGDSSDSGSKLYHYSLGQSQGDNQDIKPSTSSHANFSPSLTISSKKNKKSNCMLAKKVSVSEGSSTLNKKSSGIKDGGITKQSGIGHEAFSGSLKLKSGADSSKRGSTGGGLNHLKHSKKSGDHIKGNVPRESLKLDSAPCRKEHISQNIGNLEESDGLEDMETLEEHTHGHTYGPKIAVVLGLGKPSLGSADGRFHPRRSTPPKINVDTMTSLQKGTKKKDATSSNVCVDKSVKQLGSNKPIARVRGYPGPEVKTGVAGPDNSGEKASLLAKHHRWPAEALSNSAVSFGDRGENVSHGPKNDASSRIGMFSTRLPKKRRAVYLYEDDEDELPKTPVHEGLSRNVKVSISGAHNPKISDATDGDSDVPKVGSLGSSASKDGRPMEPSSQKKEDALSPLQMEALENITKRETSARVASSSKGSEIESSSLNGIKEILISPKRSPGLLRVSKATPEQQKSTQPQTMPSNTVKQKKAPSGSHNGLNSLSVDLKLFQNRTSSQRNRAESSLERLKGTPKTISQAHASMLTENATEFNHSQSERLDIAGDSSTLFSSSSTLDSALSMKHLIAAAQAKRRQTQAQNFSVGALSFPAVLSTGVQGMSPSSCGLHLPPGTCSLVQAELQGSNNDMSLTSPSARGGPTGSQNQENAEDLAERKANFVSGDAGESVIGGSEATVAHDAFEGMIETLSRAKDSIGRATRHAIDCAKFGIANEVVELLIRKLEDEPSLHRKVNIFFLVDSITQCSHSQKGIAGASYIPIVQSALPRLLGAAAPPGAGARENRRQCLKVLRLWLERKILPQSVLRQYMDDIGVSNDDGTSGSSIRRPSRAERSVDDPIREMEGMFVDEYGSNATVQLPGFLPTLAFEDDEEEEDHNLPICPGKGDRVATSPEELTAVYGEARAADATPNDQHHCILRDVDRELDMEDVSGYPKNKRSLAIHIVELKADPQETDEIHELASGDSAEFPPHPEDSPPLPLNSPPPPPPLPPSPPPPLPLSPSAPPPPPSLPSEPQLPPAPPSGPPPSTGPTFMPPSHPLPSQSVVSSQPPFQSLPQLGNQAVQMPSRNAHGILADTFVKSELSMQQPAVFVSAGINSQEPSGFNPSRQSEYGCSAQYLSSQASQHQQYQQSNMPYAQRPPHIIPPQNVSSQYSYTTPPIPRHPPHHHYAHQYSYTPTDGRMQFGSDKSWRASSSEFNAEKQSGLWMNNARNASTPGGVYSPKGYMQGYFERPPSKNLPFHPPPMTNPPLPAPFSSHAGAHMMPPRPDISSLNCWRPS